MGVAVGKAVGEGVLGVGEGVIGADVAVFVGIGLDGVTTWTVGPKIFGRSNTLAPTRISTEGSYVPSEEYGWVVRGTAVHSIGAPSAKLKPYWIFGTGGGGRWNRSSNRTFWSTSTVDGVALRITRFARLAVISIGGGTVGLATTSLGDRGAGYSFNISGVTRRNGIWGGLVALSLRGGCGGGIVGLGARSGIGRRERVMGVAVFSVFNNRGGVARLD